MAAQENTLLEVKTGITEIKTDVAGMKSYISSVNANVSTIKTNIGAENDTGSTVAEGTVFGKLNKTVNDITSHAEAWTAAMADKIDEIEAYVKQTLGQTQYAGQSEAYWVNVAKIWQAV